MVDPVVDPVTDAIKTIEEGDGVERLLQCQSVEDGLNELVELVPEAWVWDSMTRRHLFLYLQRVYGIDLGVKETYEEVAEKFDTLGPLGVTAENHKIVGITPPQELSKNPGKTLLGLWTDDQILRYLRDEKKIIEQYSGEGHKEDSAIQGLLQDRRRLLGLSVNLLKRVGRLPEEFTDFSPG